ncbi:MAG: carboxylesterase/lipase family protein [Oscillospiraceae bacterium]|nr:carboxylesterase/lipase family protein [Oscillospiraceae bacterium]
MIKKAQTKFGVVRGIELSGKYAGITTFRSVPYAAPPVGELRFRPPVDPEPWVGELDASLGGPRPVQETGEGLTREPWLSDFYYVGTPPMSEDCLYLSITTGAADDTERRPVYMWFHGGGLSGGYYTEIEFDPSELARKGIVVVSVAQRLNVFGYLALPQLSAEQGGISGNYGLMDEIKALEWVRENITNFGGDPDNITVGGQSGGTGKSTALATSPKTQGMIKRCINESGLAWVRGDYQTLDRAYANNIEYLRKVGLDPDITPDELRRVPAFKFFKQKDGTPFGFGFGGVPGSMVCDGVYVAHVSGAENMDEYGTHVDYLNGVNIGECTVRNQFAIGPTKKFETAAEFYEVMREKLGDLYDKYDFENLFPVTDENADFQSRVLASQNCGTGLGLTMADRYFGAYRCQTAPDTRNWSYNFGRFPPCRPEERGTVRDTDLQLAWHSAELWYVFASLREGIPAARPWEPIDFELAEQMSSYWANFIATGDPNGTDSNGDPLPFGPESRDNYGWLEVTAEGPKGHDGLTKLDEMGLEYLKRSGRYPQLKE